MAATAERVGLSGLPPRPWVLYNQRRTPDHPPYSEMIQAAIRALAEGGGSTAAAIDRHIRSTYQDLPWGHHNLLPYYLRKLATAGEIARTHSGLYCLDDENPCCADAAANPPRKPSEGENGTPSRPNSPGQPHQLGGDDDGLANGDLADEDAPLAMLLPHHQKGALPHLSIRRLKQKLRERNSSTSSSSPPIEKPVGSSVVRRRGRPPKPKAAVVLGDDQKEAAAGQEGRESEAKLVGTSSTADPTGSPVLRRRGRPLKRKDAIIVKDDQRETRSRDESWQPESKLFSTSSNGDRDSSPVMKRRGRPPKRGPTVILGDEVAAARRDRLSEPLLISSSSTEDPVIGSPVTKRRGRPPKPKADLTRTDDQHEAAAADWGDRQSELKLATFSSVGDPTSSVASAPVKRRGRPKTQS